MDEKKLKEMMEQVKKDTEKAVEISNALKLALANVPGVKDNKIPLNVLMVGMADFVTEIALGAGDGLIAEGIAHDLDIAVNGLYGKFNGEASLLIRNKLQHIMMQDEIAKKSSTSH